MMNNDYCVCCGEEIAEGSQVCEYCRAKALSDRLWEELLMKFLKSEKQLWNK